MYKSLRNQVFIRRVQLFHQPNAAPRILFQPAKDDLLGTTWHSDGLDCSDSDSWFFCATRQDELLIPKPQCVELTIKGKAVLPYQIHSEDKFIFNIGHQDPRFQAKTPQLQIHLHFAHHCSGLTCHCSQLEVLRQGLDSLAFHHTGSDDGPRSTSIKRNSDLLVIYLSFNGQAVVCSAEVSYGKNPGGSVSSNRHSPLHAG